MKKSLKFALLSIIFIFCQTGVVFCPESIVVCQSLVEQKNRNKYSKAQRLRNKLIKSVRKGFELGLAFGLGAACCVDAFQILNHIPTKFDPNNPSKVAQVRSFVCVSKSYSEARLSSPLKRRCKKLEQRVSDLKTHISSAGKTLGDSEIDKPVLVSIDSIGSNEEKDVQDAQEIKDYYAGLKKGESYGYCHCSTPIGHPVGTIICSMFYAAAIAGVVTVGFGAATLVHHALKELYQKIRAKLCKDRSRQKQIKLYDVEKKQI